MKTKVLRADDPASLHRAVELLQQGAVIAVPTDTVYGVAADSANENAIDELFRVKERPSSKAIMLLLGEASDLDAVAEGVTPMQRKLAEAFWPGGLTLVVKARAHLPTNLTAETGTIGTRLPNSSVVRDLVHLLGRPLAATSANLFGGANPRDVQDVLRDFDGRIPLILDGGPSPQSVASTVLDCTVEPPRVLREGAVSSAQIEQALGISLTDGAST
jgi:L-threonylcarbamoyladenylate synthase